MDENQENLFPSEEETRKLSELALELLTVVRSTKENLGARQTTLKESRRLLLVNSQPHPTPEHLIRTQHTLEP